MPRVSEAHLAARRQQIIDAARECFLRNGLHQTSMQDVIREANLSIGAVYRYFPSKNDLIMALAEQVVDQIAGLFESLGQRQPPPSIAEAMQSAVDLVTEETGPDGLFRLALQIWAESLRDPAIAQVVRTVYGRLRAALVALARRSVETGGLPSDADPEAVGVVLLSLMPGFAIQRLMTGGPTPEAFKAGLATLLPARAG
jgi:AcrR family transcriptional regulator